MEMEAVATVPVILNVINDLQFRACRLCALTKQTNKKKRSLREILKEKFSQKCKSCYELFTLLSFQTHKTFVHLQNTNQDILNKI